MKAVVYSTQPFEKELIAKANKKKHEITLISNVLNLQTVQFAEDKDAVVVADEDDLSANVINELKKLNIKYILNRSSNISHIDKIQAALVEIEITKVSGINPEEVAMQTVRHLDKWQKNR